MSESLLCAAPAGDNAADAPGPEQLAGKFSAANLAALAASQPSLARLLAEFELPQLTWIFGRDGSLTARTEEGRWWGGSSLPLRVGRSLMKTLNLRCAAGCYLAPGTAGQIRAALEKAASAQAIIAVMPDAAAAAVAIRCEDYSADISAGRLWLVCGDSWDRQLGELLESQPGLCVPEQYFRTGLIGEEELAGMIARAGPVLTAETARRNCAMAEIQRNPIGVNNRVCVLGGSSFSLWHIAGAVLTETLCRSPGNWRPIDKDQPAAASALALAMALRECGSLAAADIFRADLPGVAPEEMPWITWATQARFPAPPRAGRDVLLLAEPAWRGAAISAGWSADRIVPAGWPVIAQPSPIPQNGPLALIADAAAAAMPDRLKDFSSHAVLWEHIAQELLADPLRLGSDIDHYLAARMNRLDMKEQAVDRELFRRELILPSWRRGAARMLRKAGLPLVVFGAGWDQAEEFRSLWGGPVLSRRELIRFAGVAAALVHPDPDGMAHPVHSLGRPVIRAGNSLTMIRQAQASLAGNGRIPPAAITPLSASLVLSYVRG